MAWMWSSFIDTIDCSCVSFQVFCSKKRELSIMEAGYDWDFIMFCVWFFYLQWYSVYGFSSTCWEDGKEKHWMWGFLSHSDDLWWRVEHSIIIVFPILVMSFGEIVRSWKSLLGMCFVGLLNFSWIVTLSCLYTLSDDMETWFRSSYLKQSFITFLVMQQISLHWYCCIELWIYVTMG